ncbi:MAG TPA: molybdate ABC transporter permease subunit [Acidisarcina sp.]
MNVQDLLVTLRLATVTTVTLMVLALPLARWIALVRLGRGGRGRAGYGLKGGPGIFASVVEALVALPLVLPPTVLGFYLLVFLGPRTAPGRFLAAFVGHPLAFSFSGLVVGSVIYSFPFAVQPLVAGFSSVDTELLDAAALLGAGRWRTFVEVVLPLSKRSILTAAVLAFTHTVGEFGVVLMIGGDFPGRTRTLSISIYDEVQNFAYADASRTGLLLLGFSFTALLLIYWRSAKGAVDERAG